MSALSPDTLPRAVTVYLWTVVPGTALLVPDKGGILNA